MRKDNDRILEILGLRESARQSLLKELSIHSIRRTSCILEIRRPCLTSPAKLEGTGGATGGIDGGSGGGPAADAGHGSNALRPQRRLERQRSAPGAQASPRTR